MSSKLSHLLPLLWKQPREFTARLMAVADSKSEKYLYPQPVYQSISLTQALDSVKKELGWELEGYLVEPTCQELIQRTQQAILDLPPNAPFDRSHNSDFSLAQSCYAFCRMLKPEVVVETGVAYGVSSSFILAALVENQKGTLYSIDLPPLGDHADDFVGTLVPSELKSRWRLSRGTSRQLLPSLAKSIAPIDLFIHDSLHTYRNITFELETVMPFLKRPTIIVVDDIGLNGAFGDWQRRNQSFHSYVIHEDEKDALFGFAMANGK
jgi:predicted O-methyltransferase YrrM